MLENEENCERVREGLIDCGCILLFLLVIYFFSGAGS